MSVSQSPVAGALSEMFKRAQKLDLECGVNTPNETMTAVISSST